MYLTALIEEIRRNPEKYEGKEYKKIYATIYYEVIYKIVNGKLYIKNSLKKDLDTVWAVDISEQVEEIPQEITLEEAVQAYNAGKTVTCTIKGDDAPFDETFDFNNNTLSKFVTLPFVLKLVKGKWYIKEDT